MVARSFIRQRLAGICAVMLLVLQPVAFYRDALINPHTHIPYDLVGFHLPLTWYIAESVHQGVAPLWDPYAMCGMPIHADLQAQLFYPFTWLAIAGARLFHQLSLYYFLEALIPFHMALAGAFTFILLRRMRVSPPAALLGAGIYQLSAFFASQAQHVCAVCTGPWLPLAILGIWELRAGLRRRWVAIFALALAMSFLSGFAATTAVVGGSMILFTAMLLIRREASGKTLVGIGLACLLAVLISAVELVPLLTLTRSSIASMRAQWEVDGGGVPLQSLVSFVWPDYFHIFEAPGHYTFPWNFTFMYTYCGAASVVLAAAAPFRRGSRAGVFLILAILAAFWMLGGHTPFYLTIFRILPPIVRGALYAEYALMAFCLFVAMTAAFSLDSFRRLPAAFLWGIALLTSADLIFFGSERPMNSALGNWKVETKSTDFVIGDRLRELTNGTIPPSRVDYMDSRFFRGILGPAMLGVPTADSSSPFLLQRYLHVRELIATSGKPWERDYPVNVYNSPILRMLNTGALVGTFDLSQEEISRSGLRFAGQMWQFRIYETAARLPRFYTPPNVRRAKNAAESVRLMSANTFDPAREAVVEGVGEDREGLGTSDVHVNSYGANRVDVSVSLNRPGFLATSENMYPGWSATVNGSHRPLLMTNGSFRGLDLPAGTSRIVMEYYPPWFTALMAVSGISLAGTVYLAVRVPAMDVR